MRRTAGVCSSLAPFPTTISLFLHLPTGHDTISSRGPSHGSFFVLSHSPRSGEHGLPYSAATTNDQLKQMTSTRVSSSSNQQPDYPPIPPCLLSPLSVARLLITVHPRTSVSIVIVEHSSCLLPRSSFLAASFSPF